MSVGYVAAGRIWAISGSGYSAIGPVRSSSCAVLNAAGALVAGCGPGVADCVMAGCEVAEGTVLCANPAAPSTSTALNPENGWRVFMMQPLPPVMVQA
jgi:hypothetical protein